MSRWVHSNPIRGCCGPIRVHSRWARGRELGAEHSPQATASRWVSLALSDAQATGRDQDGDAAGAKGGKSTAKIPSIFVCDCLQLAYASQGIE